MHTWVLAAKDLGMGKCVFVNKSAGVLGSWDLGRGDIQALHPCTGLAPTSVCVGITTSGDPAWGFEVLLLNGSSRHKQPRVIRCKFIWG